MLTHTTVRRLRFRIMCRVWKHFVWSIMTSPGLVLGLAFGVSVQIFREVVFVARVLESLLATEVGQVPYFIWQVVVGADTVVLLSLGIMTVSAWQLWRYGALSDLLPPPWSTRCLRNS